VRLGIWRSAVAPSDTAEKKRNIWVHNYSPSYTQKTQRYFGKLTSCKTFGAHKPIRSQLFLTTNAKFDKKIIDASAI